MIEFDLNEYNKKYNTAYLQGIADARFIVLENRDNHGDKDAWTLHTVYDTTPGATNSDGSIIGHKMIGGGCMSLSKARFLLNVLFNAMPGIPLRQCDDQVRTYISHNISPMEWHEALDSKDLMVMDKYQIYCYGIPSLPSREVVQRIEDEYYKSYPPN